MSELSFSEYQALAKTTAIYPENVKVVYPALGLCGETGEVAEKIKKVFRDGNGTISDDKKQELAKELGDVMWYLAAMCTDLGLDMGEVAHMNYQKLVDRQQRNVLHGSGDNR